MVRPHLRKLHARDSIGLVLFGPINGPFEPLVGIVRRSLSLHASPVLDVTPAGPFHRHDVAVLGDAGNARIHVFEPRAGRLDRLVVVEGGGPLRQALIGVGEFQLAVRRAPVIRCIPGYPGPTVCGEFPIPQRTPFRQFLEVWRRPDRERGPAPFGVDSHASSLCENSVKKNSIYDG